MVRERRLTPLVSVYHENPACGTISNNGTKPELILALLRYIRNVELESHRTRGQNAAGAAHPLRFVLLFCEKAVVLLSANLVEHGEVDE
jgi:hypothetical protein